MDILTGLSGQSGRPGRLGSAVALLLVLLAPPLPVAWAADPPKDAPPIVSEADRKDILEEARPPQASIPFARRSISEWVPDGRSGVYIRALQRWYFARVMQPCVGFDNAATIGFDTGQLQALNRYSYLIVNGRRCALDSLHLAGPPPWRVKPKPPATETPAKDESH